MPPTPKKYYQAPHEGPRKPTPSQPGSTLPLPTKQLQKETAAIMNPPRPTPAPKLTELQPQTPARTPAAKTSPASSAVSPAPPQPPTQPVTQPGWQVEARQWGDIVSAQAHRMREWMTYYACATCTRIMCETNSRCLPMYRNWLLGGNFDLPMLIFDKVQSKGWVESQSRKVAMMIGNSSANLQWASSILIGIALYEVLDDLAKEI